MASVVLLCICTVLMSKTLVAEKIMYKQRVLKCHISGVCCFLLFISFSFWWLNNLQSTVEDYKWILGLMSGFLHPSNNLGGSKPQYSSWYTLATLLNIT